MIKLGKVEYTAVSGGVESKASQGVRDVGVRTGPGMRQRYRSYGLTVA
jgi:hypothetical protein